MTIDQRILFCLFLLQGVVRVAALDMDKHAQLGQNYGIQGFPTIKIFGQNKNSPIEYNGARSAQGIVDSALGHLQAMVRSRLHGEDQSSSGSSSGGSSVSCGICLSNRNSVQFL